MKKYIFILLILPVFIFSSNLEIVFNDNFKIKELAQGAEITLSLNIEEYNLDRLNEKISKIIDVTNTKLKKYDVNLSYLYSRSNKIEDYNDFYETEVVFLSDKLVLSDKLNKLDNGKYEISFIEKGKKIDNLYKINERIKKINTNLVYLKIINKKLLNQKDYRYNVYSEYKIDISDIKNINKIIDILNSEGFNIIDQNFYSKNKYLNYKDIIENYKEKAISISKMLGNYKYLNYSFKELKKDYEIYPNYSRNLKMLSDANIQVPNIENNNQFNISFNLINNDKNNYENEVEIYGNSTIKPSIEGYNITFTINDDDKLKDLKKYLQYSNKYHFETNFYYTYFENDIKYEDTYKYLYELNNVTNKNFESIIMLELEDQYYFLVNSDEQYIQNKSKEIEKNLNEKGIATSLIKKVPLKKELDRQKIHKLNHQLTVKVKNFDDLENLINSLYKVGVESVNIDLIVDYNKYETQLLKQALYEAEKKLLSFDKYEIIKIEDNSLNENSNFSYNVSNLKYANNILNSIKYNENIIKKELKIIARVK